MALISVLFAGLLIASLAVSILTLIVCGRLFRAEKATLGRAAAVCVILAVPSPLALLWSNRLSQTHVLGLAMLPLVQVLAAWLLIRWLLCTGSGKAALITATWLVTSTALSVALALTCRAAVAEAFSVPTGAMAPAIFGQHVRKTCERCGYEFPVGASFRPYDPDATAVTSCTNCGATVEVSPSDPTVSGDRVLVSKLDAPRRWDLVVFPPPMDTSTMYVKRLVGLPGETIEIRGGDLYANGRRRQKPPGTLDEFWLPVVKMFAEGGELQLSRIQLYRDVYYLTAEQADPYGMPGISNPTSLAADEYLVLGDNSRLSRDARFFGPIPAGSVKGVVRCTYWPPGRVRTFVPPAEPANR